MHYLLPFPTRLQTASWPRPNLLLSLVVSGAPSDEKDALLFFVTSLALSTADPTRPRTNRRPNQHLLPRDDAEENAPGADQQQKPGRTANVELQECRQAIVVAPAAVVSAAQKLS